MIFQTNILFLKFKKFKLKGYQKALKLPQDS